MGTGSITTVTVRTGAGVGQQVAQPVRPDRELWPAMGGAVGWAWDKVIQGIYTWLANGLALLIEWCGRCGESGFAHGALRIEESAVTTAASSAVAVGP